MFIFTRITLNGFFYQQNYIRSVSYAHLNLIINNLRRHDGQWTFLSPNVKESKTVLDSGFEDGNSGFQVQDSGFFCHWRLDSGFQSLAEFQISWSVFWIPKPKILDSISKNFSDSGIPIPLHWAILSLNVLFFHFRPRDVTPGNWFFKMSSYSRTFGCLIYLRNLRQISWRKSCYLNLFR